MEIRNIAIIAHVDHGKTTLVDALLKQSENFKLKSDGPKELIMDSNELERERGITIFSKNASVKYNGVKINIVDTPGHADFGGEVERIMRMVDGALLLVDAKEGPMPQTKFVLRKAIEAGHKIILVINKLDKPDARPEWVLNAVYDLFIELRVNDTQLEFPVIYASAIQGKAGLLPSLSTLKDIRPLFDVILSYICPPIITNKPLQFLTVNLAYDNYKGKIAIGRLYSGVLKKGMAVSHLTGSGEVKKASLNAVMLFDGLNRVEVQAAEAGDIVAVSGIPDISIGETIADLEHPEALPIIKIDEPTIKMTFGVNTSPFTGKEGSYATSRNLQERLERELESDVSLRVQATDSADQWTVSGRGELHLAILIEKMRREGYELEVSKPQVIFKEINGSALPTGSGPIAKKTEPMELVSIEVPKIYSGVVLEMMGKRLGIMKDMRIDRGSALMDFIIPTRGLIGTRGDFLTSTRGKGIINSIFLGYEAYQGELASEAHGSIVATETGISNSFGLIAAQGRGKLFLGAGVLVYKGMVVGQNSKAGDVIVNVCKLKELTNFRAKDKGFQEHLHTPLTLTLEAALSYIGDDEMVEITPKSIRIRKIFLTDSERKRHLRKPEN